MTATASDELQQRQHADREPAAEIEARDLDGAGLELAAVGGEQLQQRVLDDDREAEGDEQRRQQIVAERAVEQPALQHVADRRHHRHHDDERDERIEAERVGRHQRDVGGEHDQVAVRDVDQPHHAEDQRQPGGEHGVEPAEQHALHDDVDPFHRQRSEIGGGDRLCASDARGRPSATRPSCRQ